MRFIKKTAEYNEVYREHRKISGSLFVVLYSLNTQNQEPLIGIVIKSKVGKAVARNRLKRRIRAFLLQNSEKLNRTLTAVIIARIGAAEAAWKEISADLTECFAAIEVGK